MFSPISGCISFWMWVCKLRAATSVLPQITASSRASWMKIYWSSVCWKWKFMFVCKVSITNYLQFNTKNSWDYEVKPNYQGNCIKSSSNTKFLGLTIDDSLSRKADVDQMMSQLNTACFVIRTIQAIMSLESLRMVYFAYIHSIISYGIIFWGNHHIVIRFSKSKKGW